MSVDYFTWERNNLQNRMIRILAQFIEPDDKDVSDAEFVYRLKKRFDLDWNRRQTLVDPNE